MQLQRKLEPIIDLVATTYTNFNHLKMKGFHFQLFCMYVTKQLDKSSLRIFFIK